MKILVADDSKVMRQIVIRTLRQAGFDDHDVVEAVDGTDALGKVATEQPDLVLSDWNMPNMSGIELLRTLRTQGADVPFGFVTSEGSAEMREAASSAGARFLIAKPFTSDAFRAVLQPVLGGPPVEDADAPAAAGSTETVETPVPVAKAVRDLLEGLLNREVEVNPGAVVEPQTPPGALVGVYVTSSLTMGAVASLDFTLAAYAGAAIGLVPKGGADAALEDGVLPKNLRDNAVEVLNIMASLLNVEGAAHQRLYSMHDPMEALPSDVAPGPWCPSVASTWR